jgi:hypothetical protein
MQFKKESLSICFVLKNDYNFKSYQNMLIVLAFSFLYYKLESFFYMSCTLHPIYKVFEILKHILNLSKF